MKIPLKMYMYIFFNCNSSDKPDIERLRAGLENLQILPYQWCWIEKHGHGFYLFHAVAWKSTHHLAEDMKKLSVTNTACC